MVTKKREIRNDFDSAWKDEIEWYLEEFVAFFFPQAHADIDWSRGYEFLDKELQRITRDATLGRRYADKLVKVYLKTGEEQWVLIHIEIQGKHETKFNQRMYMYEEVTHMRYVTSIERIGMEKGLQQGALRQLLRLLHHRFQNIPEEVQTRLQLLSVEQLEQLLDVALTVAALPDFVIRLPEPIQAEANADA